MYVDDTSIITNTPNRGETTRLLEKNAQIHERLLFSTGGRLALHKCFWTTLRFHWEEGKAVIEHYDEAAREQDGNEDASIKLTQGGDFSKKFVIKRIGAGTSYRTLGVYIAANGNQQRQKEVLLGRSTTWSIKVSTSNLTQEEKLTSYRQ